MIKASVKNNVSAIRVNAEVAVVSANGAASTVDYGICEGECSHSVSYGTAVTVRGIGFQFSISDRWYGSIRYCFGFPNFIQWRLRFAVPADELQRLDVDIL